jgi:hypothetical protein
MIGFFCKGLPYNGAKAPAFAKATAWLAEVQSYKKRQAKLGFIKKEGFAD